jgi:hypothetical protein
LSLQQQPPSHQPPSIPENATDEKDDEEDDDWRERKYDSDNNSEDGKQNDNIDVTNSNDAINNKRRTTTAPLLQCKLYPQRSHYLYHPDNPTLTLRARLRFNRAYTQATRHRFPSSQEEMKISPHCTYPPCLHAKLTDDVEHILLHCPRHDRARNRLYTYLLQHDQEPNTDQPQSNPISLSVPLITGCHPPESPTTQPKNNKLFLTFLSITSTYLLSIIADRVLDKALIKLDGG